MRKIIIIGLMALLFVGAYDYNEQNEEIVKSYCEYDNKTFVSYQGCDGEKYYYKAMNNYNGSVYRCETDVNYVKYIASLSN